MAMVELQMSEVLSGFRVAASCCRAVPPGVPILSIFLCSAAAVMLLSSRPALSWLFGGSACSLFLFSFTSCAGGYETLSLSGLNASHVKFAPLLPSFIACFCLTTFSFPCLAQASTLETGLSS